MFSKLIKLFIQSKLILGNGNCMSRGHIDAVNWYLSRGLNNKITSDFFFQQNSKRETGTV